MIRKRIGKALIVGFVRTVAHIGICAIIYSYLGGTLGAIGLQFIIDGWWRWLIIHSLLEFMFPVHPVTTEKRKDWVSQISDELNRGGRNRTTAGEPEFAAWIDTLSRSGVSRESIYMDMASIIFVTNGEVEYTNSLVTAWAQVQASGKLREIDYAQMNGSCFNPLKAIRSQTGESYEVLRQQMADGKISVGMVRDALHYAAGKYR